MLARRCVEDGCDGRAAASNVRVGRRPICCEGHPTNREIIEDGVRSRIKDLLGEAFAVVDVDEDLLSPEPARGKRSKENDRRRAPCLH
jgi:hypothetical protein